MSLLNLCAYSKGLYPSRYNGLRVNLIAAYHLAHDGTPLLSSSGRCVPLSRSALCQGSYQVQSVTSLLSRHCVVSNTLPRFSIVARGIATSSQPTPSHGPLKRGWKYAVSVVKSFLTGFKLFMSDVKKMRAVNARIGGYNMSGTTPIVRPDSSASWEDVRFIYQTIAGTRKVLPILVLFFIPFFGYTAPFLALFFPGQLLTKHFWSEAQKADISSKSITLRKSKLVELDTLMSKKQTELNIRLSEAIVSGDSEWLVSINNKLTENKTLTVSHRQLKLLCECWGVSTIIPLYWWRARRLRKHMTYIFAIDHLIKNADVSSIDMETVKELATERGMFTATSDNAVVRQFEEWVHLTTSFNVVPHLMVAHLPLIMKWKYQ